MVDGYYFESKFGNVRIRENRVYVKMGMLFCRALAPQYDEWR